MDYQIRQATFDDAKKANELLTKLIKDEKKYDANINNKYEVGNMYESLIENPNNYLLVVYAKTKMIGYLYGYIRNNRAYLNKVSVIASMYVENGYRRKNIGSNLLDEFSKWSLSNDIKEIEIKVLVNNEKACNLYRKYGFKIKKSIMNLQIGEKNE